MIRGCMLMEGGRSRRGRVHADIWPPSPFPNDRPRERPPKFNTSFEDWTPRENAKEWNGASESGFTARIPGTDH